MAQYKPGEDHCVGYRLVAIMRLTAYRVDNNIHRFALKLLTEVCLAVVDAFISSQLLEQDIPPQSAMAGIGAQLQES